MVGCESLTLTSLVSSYTILHVALEIAFTTNILTFLSVFSGDSKETGMALLLLFIFAIFASGYVLKEGLRKKEKTTHELLLKCVIIITSVVPRQLPMQVMMLFICRYLLPC